MSSNFFTLCNLQRIFHLWTSNLLKSSCGALEIYTRIFRITDLLVHISFIGSYFIYWFIFHLLVHISFISSYLIYWFIFPIAKASGRQMRKQLNIEIENDCKTAIEKLLNDRCHEIEELQKHFKRKEMYKEVDQFICKHKMIHTGCIKDRNGNILFDEENVGERWVK